MPSKSYRYSLIVPVYNSASTLPKLLEACEHSLSVDDTQIIFINDFSSDNSWEVLLQLKKQSQIDLILVSLASNFGQHAALFCGLQYAEGEYIVTLDDDLQHHPREIEKLAEAIESENADLVYGIYAQKEHGALRNMGSVAFAAIVNKFASTPLQGSSFKLMRKSLVEKVLHHPHYNFYLDEVIAWYSKKTSFTQVEHGKRLHGSSGYSPVSLIKMSIGILLNYTALPLKFITGLGILSSLISFGVGIFYMYEKLNNDAQVGFTAIIVSIFFSTGLILFSLGIIGEYISRIFLIQTGKPPFKIKEVEL